jgi:ATP-dependent RNA helicase DHX29
MTTYDWLSEDVLDHIVSLAQAESNDSNRKQGQQSLLKVLSEEDALVKLWILELTLRELAFSDDHIVSVLKWLCANAINVDTTAVIWGFQEGLEWLALDQCEGHSFSYDELKNKPSAVQAPAFHSSRPHIWEEPANPMKFSASFQILPYMHEILASSPPSYSISLTFLLLTGCRHANSGVGTGRSTRH